MTETCAAGELHTLDTEGVFVAIEIAVVVEVGVAVRATALISERGAIVRVEEVLIRVPSGAIPSVVESVV